MSLDFVRTSSEFLTASGVTGLLSGKSALTIWAWVKPTSLPDGWLKWYNAWRRPGSATDYHQAYLANNGTALRCGIKTTVDAEVNVTPGKTVSTGVWQQVAMTWDGSTITGYLNGSAGGTTGSATGVIVEYMSYNHVGEWYSSGTSKYIDAKMQDIAVWDRALSADEIASAYNCRLCALFFLDGLIRYLPFDCPGDAAGGDFADGDWGGRDVVGSLPVVLGTAPAWSDDSPLLVYPSKPHVMPVAALTTPCGMLTRVPHQRISSGSPMRLGAVGVSSGRILDAEWPLSGLATTTGVVFTITGQGHSATPINAGAWARNNDIAPIWDRATTVASTDFSSDGEFTVSCTLKGYDGGERTLPDAKFVVDQSGTLAAAEAWVDSVSGNDGTGTVGDSELPFEHIHAAIAALETSQGNVDGCFVYLEEGSYRAWNGGVTTERTCTQEWCTIKAASGAAKANVKIDQDISGVVPSVKYLKFEGITFEATTSIKLLRGSALSNDEVWIHDCVVTGSGQFDITSFEGEPLDFTDFAVRYVTDSSVSDVFRAINAQTYLRSVTCTNVGEDMTTHATQAIGVIGSNISPRLMADVTGVDWDHDTKTFSKTGGFAEYMTHAEGALDQVRVDEPLTHDGAYNEISRTANAIVVAEYADGDVTGTVRCSVRRVDHSDAISVQSGVDVDNLFLLNCQMTEIGYQGILIKDPSPLHLRGDFAIVNCYLECNSNPYAMQVLFLGDARSLTLWHNTFRAENEQYDSANSRGHFRLGLQANSPPKDITISNVSCRLNHFSALNIEDDVDGKTLTMSTEGFIDNNFWWVDDRAAIRDRPGTEVTESDPTLDADGVPLPGSPLLNRNTKNLMPFDALWRARGGVTVGAMELATTGVIIGDGVAGAGAIVGG